MDRPDLFINNQWMAGSGILFQSVNPASGAMIWEGKAAAETEVDAAVAAARFASQDWSLLSLKERIHYLEQFRDLLTQSQDEFAEVISKEVGKPLWEAKTEVKGMIGKVGISIQAYQERTGEKFIEQGTGRLITRHRPHGVIAVLGPFNFPGHLPNGHIVPALLAGNTVVFKPSELTPMVGEKTIEIWEQCHLPNGVINMIQGGRDTGRLLLEQQDLDGLFFTGSWRTGQLLSEHFSKYPEKILALEMGGNNPLIVFDVQDFRAAAYLTVQSAFLTSGQRCSCARRLIIEEGQKGEDFLQELLNLTKSLKIGTYNESPEPFMGPVISAKAAADLLEKQKFLIDKGAIPILQMKSLRPNTGFLSPGILNVTNMISRPDEEIFGPLLQVIKVKNFDEAVQEANNTTYGLCAGILTDDEEKYHIFRDRGQVGIINWNTQITGASGLAPFGGIGRSGNHHPSGYYAADYCSYPVVSMEVSKVHFPETLTPGVGFDVRK